MHGHPVVKWSNLLIWYFGRYEEEPSLFLSSAEIMSLPSHLNDEWQCLKVKPCGYSMMHSSLLILAFLWVAHKRDFTEVNMKWLIFSLFIFPTLQKVSQLIYFFIEFFKEFFWKTFYRIFLKIFFRIFIKKKIRIF